MSSAFIYKHLIVVCLTSIDLIDRTLEVVRTAAWEKAHTALTVRNDQCLPARHITNSWPFQEKEPLKRFPFFKTEIEKGDKKPCRMAGHVKCSFFTKGKDGHWGREWPIYRCVGVG